MTEHILIFAGTTEGRLLAEILGKNRVDATVCVATEYGEQLIGAQECLHVLAGRQTTQEMEAQMRALGKPLVIDATHPYATAVSENIREACEKSKSRYVRLLREKSEEPGGVIKAASVEEAVDFLKTTDGNVLVTTGSKELHRFCEVPGYEERIFARVLSTASVAEHCTALGFEGKHLICMQGPFSEELNYAMLRQLDAKWMVTKESGAAGGFEEKVRAAKRAGAGLVLIQRPVEESGLSFEKTLTFLETELDRILETPDLLECSDRGGEGSDIRRSQSDGKRKSGSGRRIVLAGIGMGTMEGMTEEVRSSCAKADLLIGAKRMLDSVRTLGKPEFCSYQPLEMRSYLEEHQEFQNIVILLSGDIGFYSGAKKIYEVFESGEYELITCPGISSVVYLCAKLHTAWEDVKLLSTHGRKANVVAAVKSHEKTFTLLSRKDSVRTLCEELMEYGLETVTVTVGERLGYAEEKLTGGTPEELSRGSFDDLCVALITNPNYDFGIPMGISEETFIRGKAPMTKSEVRAVSVAKLHLKKDSICYDIGAGTGSVSVEMALQACDGEVYAVEKKPDPLELLKQNQKKFGVPNLQIIPGSAPEALENLPAPTHAFIGGSSGNLKEIVKLLLEKNPRVRIVMNAITLETVAEMNEVLKTMPLKETEIVQLNVAKAKTVGSYEMMMGQNPVYIAVGEGDGTYGRA